MLIIMNKGISSATITTVCQKIEGRGYTADLIQGAHPAAIYIYVDKGNVDEKYFSSLPGVSKVINISKPYQLASRESKPENTIITVNNQRIGQDFVMIAGPCSIEHESATMRIAEKLHKMGIRLFRGGAYKPRTSPYMFQGLGEEGLKLLAKVKQEFSMGIVTEVLDIETLPLVEDVADIVQVGTRNMSNSSLLKRLGKCKKPILLKRGMGSTLDEYLLAAEYILIHGNPQVILCERGIRTFNTHVRNTLDVAAIPVLRQLSHLPVIADPSHAAGVTSLVKPLCFAAVAAGAQGLIIETHDDALNAYCDGQQSLHPDSLKNIMQQVTELQKIVGDFGHP